VKTHVLSLQTTLLGNRTYGELLRRAFSASEAIDFDAHWSDEAREAYAQRPFERQLDRVFLKMIRLPAIRTRNLDFFPLRYELGTSYWARRTLAPLVRARTPDVLHVHTQAIAMLSLDVMARVPTVVSIDGTSVQMAAQQLEPAWRWTFAGNDLLERAIFRRAAAVTAFSQWAADSVVADHGIDPGRVHAIPPGIDLSLFPAHASRAERPAGTPLRILFMGGEFERKGGPRLVDAFLRRFANNENVELHIATKAARVPHHPRIFVHLGVEAYGPAWYELYRNADLFVLPTKRDQSPIAFLEAMAAGLPVITTPVGSAPEIVRDGETGFVIAGDDPAILAERIATVLNDSGLRARLGAAGRARVERDYEEKKNAARFERVLLDAAASRGRRPGE
jgi:glycosyltransferase involved in cell wall biosynthesis